MGASLEQCGWNFELHCELHYELHYGLPYELYKRKKANKVVVNLAQLYKRFNPVKVLPKAWTPIGMNKITFTSTC